MEIIRKIPAGAYTSFYSIKGKFDPLRKMNQAVMYSKNKYRLQAKAIIVFLVVAIACILPQGTVASDQTRERASVILQKIDDMWRSSSSMSRLKMIVKTRHYTRTMAMDNWTKGKEKSLVRITSPLKEKGMISLKNDNTMYTYLPKTDRVIRLTSGMMMGSWMGSHFTNDDLVKESRLSEDYDPVITFEGLRNGRQIIEFDLVPKPDAPVVWGKIAIAVLEEGYIPLVSRYYDEDLVLARTLEFNRIQQMGGRRIPAVMHMVPADKPGEYTELIYEEIEFDIPIQDSMFSLMQLRRM